MNIDKLGELNEISITYINAIYWAQFCSNNY